MLSKEERSIINSNNKAGSKSQKVLIKEKVREEMMQRIFGMTHKLVNAQYMNAIGTHKMIQVMNGPGDTKITRTVRDQDEMQRLLDEGIYGVDYIILMGKESDWKAANALLDRAMGKAKESIEINATVENIATDDKEKGDQAIIDYLAGKRGVTVPNSPKPLRVDDLKYNG